jgi:hypothetical protein
LRSEHVSWAVVSAAVAAVVSASTPAWAEASVARLDVDAQPSCSSRDELIARIAARSTRIRFVDDGDGIPRMTARIDAAPKGLVVAELTVVEPDGRRFSRRLEAPSCAAATDALALVVAITLDPSASLAEAPPDASATTKVAPPPPPETTVARTASPAGAGAVAPPVASTRRLTVAVTGEVIAGPAPTVMPGVAMEIQAALDRTSLWSPAIILTLSHLWSGVQSEPGGDADFVLDLVGLEACPVRLTAALLEARACAAGALGRLTANGSNTYDPQAVVRPFGTAGGTARLGMVLGGRVELRARFGAGATLWRDAFQFSPNVFHRVASVTLVGDVGVGVRFP